MRPRLAPRSTRSSVASRMSSLSGASGRVSCDRRRSSQSSNPRSRRPLRSRGRDTPQSGIASTSQPRRRFPQPATCADPSPGRREPTRRDATQRESSTPRRSRARSAHCCCRQRRPARGPTQRGRTISLGPPTGETRLQVPSEEVRPSSEPRRGGSGDPREQWDLHLLRAEPAMLAVETLHEAAGLVPEDRLAVVGQDDDVAESGL
jgi:hypothetical protein